MFLRRIAPPLIVAGLLATSLNASGAWLMRFQFQGTWSYDSNVYNLSPSQILTLQAPDPGDILNGRFKDMNSAFDNILRPGLAAGASGPLFFGRKLTLGLAVNSEAYLQNTRKSNFAIALTAGQELWRGASLRLAADYNPRNFRKNYLLDAIPNAKGHVDREFRIYAPGIYSEWNLEGGLEQRFFGGAAGGPVELSLALGTTFLDRRFEEFPGRNRKSLSLDVGASVSFWSRIDLSFLYRSEGAKSPVTQEILLLDEAEFGINFNHDHDTTDTNIRVPALVDRSFKADHYEGVLRAQVTRTTVVRARAARRLREFTSLEPFDGYRGRQDKRWIYGLDAEQRLTTWLALSAGYRYIDQKANRPDLTEDEEDYSKHNYRAGFVIRF